MSDNNSNNQTQTAAEVAANKRKRHRTSWWTRGTHLSLDVAIIGIGTQIGNLAFANLAENGLTVKNAIGVVAGGIIRAVGFAYLAGDAVDMIADELDDRQARAMEEILQGL